MKSHRARNSALILVPLLLNLFMALTPYMPFTRGIWQLNRPQDFYAVLACFVGVDFTILYGAFALLFTSSQADANEALSEFAHRLPVARIRKLTDAEFYREFLSACQSARSSVRIAYLSPNPPMEAAPKDRTQYYAAIGDLMRRRENVQFFRLIRLGRANLEWIAGFLREFEAVPNVSVAVIKDMPETESSSLGLSVQIVDDDQAWLVALDGHERRGPYRDIAVENGLFAEGMTKYYERLWSLGDVILQNGRQTEAGQRLAHEYARKK